MLAIGKDFEEHIQEVVNKAACYSCDHGWRHTCHGQCFRKWHLGPQSDWLGRHWLVQASKGVRVSFSTHADLVCQVDHQFREAAPCWRIRGALKGEAPADKGEGAQCSARLGHDCCAVCNPLKRFTAVMLGDEDSLSWPSKSQGNNVMDDPWEAPPTNHFGTGLHRRDGMSTETPSAPAPPTTTLPLLMLAPFPTSLTRLSMSHHLEVNRVRGSRNPPPRQKAMGTRVAKYTCQCKTAQATGFFGSSWSFRSFRSFRHNRCLERKSHRCIITRHILHHWGDFKQWVKNATFRTTVDFFSCRHRRRPRRPPRRQDHPPRDFSSVTGCPEST
jgi:hypothetical protein